MISPIILGSLFIGQCRGLPVFLIVYGVLCTIMQSIKWWFRLSDSFQWPLSSQADSYVLAVQLFILPPSIYGFTVSLMEVKDYEASPTCDPTVLLVSFFLATIPLMMVMLVILSLCVRACKARMSRQQSGTMLQGAHTWGQPA
eukprot:TRINITY_DN3362_c0_g1_i5.p2 TRINITY_DN3362_c0_g1~~TRINITY_DN3362_c0_g1_i5.p2  ORF type:complete len:143 (+),score=11.23 TRINITY_DN3362_c0_g1_i5:166-594(+)